MFGVDPLTLIVVLAVAFVAGRFIYKKDSEKEARRKAAIKMASMTSQLGLPHLTDFLEDYAVGDYSGMAKTIKEAAVLLNDPVHAKAMLDKAADSIVAARSAKAE